MVAYFSPVFRVGLLALLLMAGVATRADTATALWLPSFFSDNMVMQRGKAPVVWGRAEPGATVTVEITAHLRSSAKADHEGRWRATLDALPAGGAPFEMTVRSGSATKVIRNILAGEVWFCSGQSNMAWTLGASEGGRRAATADPAMRFFVTAFHAPYAPAEDCEGEWVECTPETALRFSGVAYFFGRKLRDELRAPVGLVLSAQGATAIEAWMSRDALSGDPDLKPILDSVDGMVIDPKGWDMHLPGGLFNGRILPLAPMRMAGVIWYQGETNAARGWQYRKLFPRLIENWRAAWGEELPFYFVQVANYLAPKDRPVDEPWAELRESQAAALRLPRTGMAVAIDVGEEGDIHPKRKGFVGDRLASLALAGVYDRKIVASGPLYRAMTIEGSRVRIAFDSLGSGLEARGGELKRFAIAGDDRRFVWADAQIDGETVVVSSPQVSAPKAVRYAWANNPSGSNLYNRDGFPAAPFRTDDWPGVTDRAHLKGAPARRVQPPRDPEPLASVGMTGNSVDVDFAKNIARPWDVVKANGYRHGARHERDAGEIHVWLPYGNERGFYHRIKGMKLIDTAPGVPAALVYDGNGKPGELVLRLRFSAPISSIRLSFGPIGFQSADAVASVDYSVDGRTWTAFKETTASGNLNRWIDPKGPSVSGLDTRELYLRCHVRGKTDPSVVPPDTVFWSRMGGDVMWGDASRTFAAAQWQIWLTPKDKP